MVACTHKCLSGAIWSYLELSELSGAIWSYLELSGAIWNYLDISKAIWTYPELSRNIWSYLELWLKLSVAICSYLELSGAESIMGLTRYVCSFFGLSEDTQSWYLIGMHGLREP